MFYKVVKWLKSFTDVHATKSFLGGYFGGSLGALKGLNFLVNEINIVTCIRQDFFQDQIQAV